MSAGQQMFLGIKLWLDSSGAVKGAASTEQALAKVQKQAKQAQAEINNMASLAMGAVGGGLMAVSNGISSKILQPAMEVTRKYQMELAQLTYVAGTTREEMAKMEKFAEDVGIKTMFSPTEALSGLTQQVAAGLSPKEAMGNLEPILDYATATLGKLSLETVSAASTALRMKFRHTGNELRSQLDAFAVAGKESLLFMEDLPTYINSIGDVSSKLKLSEADAFAFGAALSNSGQQAAQAGNTVVGFGRALIKNESALKRWMDQKNRPGKKPITAQDFWTKNIAELEGTGRAMPQKLRAMKALGVQIFDPVSNDIKSMEQIITELANNMGGLRGDNYKEYLNTVTTAFDTQSSAFLSAVLAMNESGEKGAQGYLRVQNAAKNSAGAVREQAALIEGTMDGLSKLLEGSIETISTRLGNSMVPLFGVISSNATKLVNQFLALTEGNTEFYGSLGITLEIVAGLTKVLGLLAIGMAGAMFWASVLGPAVAAAGGWAAVASIGFNALMASLKPMLIFGAVVLALFVGVYAASKAWSWMMSDSATGVFKTFQNMVKDIQLVWQGLIEFWDGKGSVDLHKALKKKGLDKTVLALLQIKEKVTAILKGMWKGVVTALTPVFYVLKLVGSAVLWVATKFMNLFSAGGVSSNLREQIPLWYALGTAIGALMVLKVGVSIATMVAAMWKLVIPTSIVGLKIWLIVAGLLAYGAAVLIAKDAGEKLGPMMYEWVEDLQVSFAELIFKVQKFCSLVAVAIPAALKGNIGPLKDLLSGNFDLSISATDSAAIRSVVQGGIMNATPQKMEEERVYAQYEAKQITGKQRLQALATIKEKYAAKGERTTNITVPNVTVNLTGTTPEDAEKFATSMWDAMNSKADSEAEKEFYF